ncbi:MAG: polyprenyl synthetase family protein [Candidatus Methanofastidiosia archaeon]
MAFLDTYLPVINQVEEEINSYLNENIAKNKNPILDEFYRLVKKNILSGGKRLRPLSMIMAYRCFKNDDKIIKSSISSELVHASSLILDDAMDEDVLRHGEPTFNAVYADKFLDVVGFDLSKYSKGRYWVQRDTLKSLFFAQRAVSRYSYALSVLGSNIIYSMSLEALLRSPFDPKEKAAAIELHSRMYQKLNEGQLMDILYESHHANEEEYLEMIQKKTGILFIYPLRIGLTFCGAKNIHILDDYAKAMAKAFQIHDDILGTFGSEQVTGKPSYSDITEGKRTLMVIKAFENADARQKKRLESVLGYEHASKEDVIEVRDIFKDTGAYEYCNDLARSFVEKSKAFVPEDIPKEPQKFFMGLSDFVISRDY